MTPGKSFIDDLSDIPDFNNIHAGKKDRGFVTAEEAAEMGDLDDDVAKPDNRPTFPCESCAGTGKYRGVRLHQPATECFACKGKGFFYMSYADRMKARQKRASKKLGLLEEAKSAFNDVNPGFIADLEAIASWHDFARSLVTQFNERGTLSERQVAAGRSAIERVVAREAEKAKAKEAKSGAVDMSAIEKMFATAQANGLKRPQFHVGELKISLAPANGRNAGALYVVRNPDAYQGKVLNGQFQAVNSAQADTLALLLDVASNPAAKAREYGKLSGRCCCCGRELTDPVSVDQGIGPICANKWGL